MSHSPEALATGDPSTVVMSDNGVDVLLTERQRSHGDFSQNAIYGQELRSLFRSSPAWPAMPPAQREALDLIACKLSRILSGHARYADHWRDVSGYAALALKECP